MGSTSDRAEPPARAAWHGWIAGRVQGVAFRWHTQRCARELDLGGWVRNLSDGRVEVWAEGAEPSVERFKRWLEHGPPAAQVERVEGGSAEARGFDDFEVRR